MANRRKRTTEEEGAHTWELQAQFPLGRTSLEALAAEREQQRSERPGALQEQDPVSTSKTLLAHVERLLARAGTDGNADAAAVRAVVEALVRILEDHRFEEPAPL